MDHVCTGFTPQFQAISRKIDALTAKYDVVRSESDSQEKRRLNRLYRGLGRYLGATARVFSAMTDQVAVVTPAPGDEAAVSQWIEGLRQFGALQAQMAPALKHHKLLRVVRLSQQSVEALNSGGAAVASFGIGPCPTHIDVVGGS